MIGEAKRHRSGAARTRSCVIRWLSWGSSIAIVAGAAGCGDPIGKACRFEGSGFLARDGCRHRCLQHREIVCPDGDVLKPAVCSGAAGCEPGGCPAGQVCDHVADPFAVESDCVEAELCGELDEGTLTG